MSVFSHFLLAVNIEVLFFPLFVIFHQHERCYAERELRIVHVEFNIKMKFASVMDDIRRQNFMLFWVVSGSLNLIIFPE